MDGGRSAMVSDYRSGSGGSNSSTSSAKYTQKRQRLEQIALSLEEPARTRNSLSSSRSNTNQRSSNKQPSSSRSNKRQPSSSSQSRSKDEKPNAVKTRSKNAEEEEVPKQDNQQHCIVCKRGVRNTRDLRHCLKCKKCSHATCNSGFVFVDTQNGYLCLECAKKEKLSSPTHSSNNNTTIAADSNSIEEEEFGGVSEEEANRPSCSQSVHTSDEELGSTAKNAQTTNDDSIASNVQARKRNRRTRTRSSPQQQPVLTAIRSNSSASEEQSSPVGNKLLKTRISGSPSSSSIGISMTTAEPSNDAQTPSEVSLSPESGSEANVSKQNENATENQTTKQTSQRSRKNEEKGKRSRGPSQKKPAAANRTGPTMRTRFAGQPTPSIAQVTNIYSIYERSGGKASRGRKSGKGKSSGGRGRRGKVMPTITKSRGRQAQSTSGYSQNSVDNGDGQSRMRSHDENDYLRTAVVNCITNKFMDSVSLCLICGSIGQDTEGAMLTCASCAQSYHIFCINSRPNSTILERGWRCLDCSICEECGSDKDEQNLLICDSCDVSYHIYCLEPKLAQIPNGPWRCKWCATCCRCKKQVPSDLDLLTLEGFCETCYSLRKCPKCTTLYEAGDLLVKCQHCIRWFHARCEDLTTEEQVETASENAFRCTFCRPKINSGYEHSTLILDNVMVSRNTLDHVNTLRRSNLNLTYVDGAYRSIPMDTDEYEDECDPPYSSRGGRGRGGPGRRVLKIGIGGFHVRMPRQRLPANTPDEKELTFPNAPAEEDDPAGAVHNTPGKRMRRPRRPRRPKLEESYPAAIQEAFFGIQPVDSKSLVDVVVDEPVLGEHYNVKMEDRTRNLGCELSDQAADAIRVDDLGFFDDLLRDDDIGIDITELSMFMEDGENNASTTNQIDGGFNIGGAGISGVFGDDKHQFGGNFMHDDQNEENNEDGDLTNEQFHAQMEQSHEKQRQIQQQTRLQMGTSGQPNAQNGNENGAKSLANLSEKINQACMNWKLDEPLGDKATKAAVLFANLEHAYLKEKFPLWSDRVKRINNLWRRADSEIRDKYVKKARENRADVPKRRTRRATSTAQIGGSMEDFGEASQDSNHSHMDHPGEQRNEQQRPPETRPNFNAEQPIYPNATHPSAQQFKLATPRQSIDGHLNGMTPVQMPPGMRPMPDPKMHSNRPDTLKDARSGSLSQERAPVISPAEWERYRILREKNNMVNEQRTKIDEELIKLRKIKKNSKAKLRSLCRNQEAMPMNAMRPGYVNNDIVEAERRVDNVTKDIADQQRLMEQCKQEQKELMSQLQSFETRYHLNPAATPIPMTPGAETHPQMPFPPQHSQQIIYQQHQQPTPTLSSPPYSFVPHGGMNPAFAPFKQNSFYGIESSDTFAPGPNSFYPSPSGIRLSSFNNFQAASPVMSNPPSPLSVRPTSSASTEVAQKSSRGRKRRRPVDEIRTPKMGNVVYNLLTDPLEREIYSVVDLMVGWVEAAVESNSEELFNKLPTMRTSNLQSDPETMSDTKAKRRRNVVRKPPNQDANEYEAFVEKLQTQLKLCPMPVLTYEQSSFIDTSLPQFSDMTQFQQEIGHEFVKGTEIDDYHLTFMPDYYAYVERQTSFDTTPLYPAPMSKIYADVDLEDLETAEEPTYNTKTEKPPNESSQIEIKKEAEEEEKSVETTTEALATETQKPTESGIQKADSSAKKPSKNASKDINPADLEHYELFWLDVTADEVGNACCIPQLYKPNGDSDEYPIPPHRSVFQSQKPRHLDHRYAVTLTIENVNLDEKVLNELQAIINNPTDLEIIERTPPPESPQQIKEELQVEELAESVINQMCRQCDGLIKNNRVAEILSKLGVGSAEDDEFNTFCSLTCYLTFMAETNTSIAPELYKHAARFVDESVVDQLTQAESALKRNELMPAEHELKLNLTGGTSSASQTRTSTTNLLSPIDVYFDPNYYSFGYEPASHSNELPLRVCDLPPLGQNNKSVLTSGEYKWKGFGWQIYDDQLILSFKKVQEDIHQKLVAVQVQCAERNRAYRNEDSRVCSFCGRAGDGDQDITGRLLNIDANRWVHVNCALWSTEVYENENGVLKNVDVALKSAQTVQCKVCQRNGASLRCYKHGCENNKSFYHLPCAKSANAKFGKDKIFFCPNHDIRQDVCIKKLGAMRRICIERDETQLLAKVFNHSYSTEMSLRVGSMIFRSIGQLTPEQLKNFHSEEHIYPVGFHITRLFWSPVNSRELSRYECTISDDNGEPMFHVQLTEGQSKICSDRTMAGAWNEVFQSVKRIRNKEMLQFYPELMNASTLFGLQEPAITKIAESLPGVDQMFKYSLSHENSPLLDLPLAVNPTGCARCEPRSRALIKHRSRPLITQSPRKKMQGPTNNEFTPEIIPREARRTRSQRCLLTAAFGDENFIQMMRRSGITESMLTGSQVRYDTASLQNAHSQYKKMKQDWKKYVYLGRSGIQGLGLFAKMDLDMNTMIIEYIGEVIRSELGEVREKKYLSQNRGIYMFRIDDEYIVDATVTGGLARYINHGCDPNCTTKVLQYNDEKKIVIIANRPIKAGEELCYEYNFELEGTDDKIPCLCGAPNCVRWMN